jgi:hypothetical protein
VAKDWQRQNCPAVLTASECSLTPIPDFDSVCNRKHAVVEATEDATRAIATRNFNFHESEEFDWLNKLSEKSEQYEQKLEICNCMYSHMKCKFSSDMLTSKLKRIKLKYELVKRAKKRYNLEHKQIKEQMVWKTPPSWDSSLSNDSLSGPSKEGHQEQHQYK